MDAEQLGDLPLAFESQLNGVHDSLSKV